MPAAVVDRLSGDLAEARGAVGIAVAGPGSSTGRCPGGNHGRASVPATRPMPVLDHRRPLLEVRDG